MCTHVNSMQTVYKQKLMMYCWWCVVFLMTLVYLLSNLLPCNSKWIKLHWNFFNLFIYFQITDPPHLFICQFIKSVKASPCQRNGRIRLHIQQLMTDSWHVSVTLFIHTFSATLSQRCDSNLITAHTSLLLTDVWTESKFICMKCIFFFFLDDAMNGWKSSQSHHRDTHTYLMPTLPASVTKMHTFSCHLRLAWLAFSMYGNVSFSCFCHITNNLSLSQLCEQATFGMTCILGKCKELCQYGQARNVYFKL